MARNSSFSDDASADVGQASAPVENAGAEPVIAPSSPADPSPAPEAAPPPPHNFTVAAGCTVHCLKGPVHAGEPLRAMDLAGGQEALDAFVASGHVDDNRPKA